MLSRPLFQVFLKYLNFGTLNLKIYHLSYLHNCGLAVARYSSRAAGRGAPASFLAPLRGDCLDQPPGQRHVVPWAPGYLEREGPGISSLWVRAVSVQS